MHRRRRANGDEAEPSLGALPTVNQTLAWRHQSQSGCGDEDREQEDEHDEEGHDAEATNEDGGDINDEPQDEDTDAEPSLGWTADGEVGAGFVHDGELAAELTNAERQVARDRKKSGGTGVANVTLDYAHWRGTIGVTLPSGETLRR